jgi:hypothetical protein
MFPVLIVGLVILYASIRHLIDGEPIRLRFIGVMVLVQLALLAQSSLANVAAVLHATARSKPDIRWVLLVQGLYECTRPALLGFGLLCLALILVAIGVYRVSQRELKAARG